MSDGLFCYERNGQYLGFDRELIELSASALKQEYGLDELKLIPYEYSWEQIFEAPRSAQVDLAIANITLNNDRTSMPSCFPDRIGAVSWSLITSWTTGDLRPFPTYALADLQGKRIGYHKTTTAADFVPMLTPNGAPNKIIYL
ncbi:MAG TPA: transporter substrate-binding domain-containing protein [Candidatus Angelobacter sp.]|nr:transporter substrate-binding domain-containing protein [Candidatus Angelobacter sp.]